MPKEKTVAEAREAVDEAYREVDRVRRSGRARSLWRAHRAALRATARALRAEERTRAAYDAVVGYAERKMMNAEAALRRVQGTAAKRRP